MIHCPILMDALQIIMDVSYEIICSYVFIKTYSFRLILEKSVERDGFEVFNTKFEV